MTSLLFADLFIPTAARGLVLLGCVEIVLLVLKRRQASAAQRHLVLLTGLILLLALPALSLLLPARTVIKQTFARPLIAPADATPPVLAMLSLADRIAAARPVRPTPEPARALPPGITAPSPTPASSTADASSTSAATERVSRSIAEAIVAIYLSGVTLCALRFALAYGSLRKIARRHYREITDPGWTSRVSSLARTQGCARNIRILHARNPVSAPFVTPVTYGAVNPTLLLPGETIDEQWPASCTDAVLRHEIAHVQRADWVTQLLANAACALYWFNPWVWKQARRMNAMAEAACDDRALQAGVEATDYAEHLLSVARTVRRRGSMTPRWTSFWQGDAVLGMAQVPTNVEERLSSVLASHRSRAIVPARTLVGVLAFALLIIAPAAATRRTVRETRDAEFLASTNGEALALMQRVQDATLRLRSMTADFTYTEKTVATTGEWATRLGKDGQSISARIEMMRPNYARVRFTHMVKPAFPNLVACDGKTVYTFTPSSFLPPRRFAAGGYDPSTIGSQASGLRAGGGQYSAVSARAAGGNVHLWDAAPVQAFFDPMSAMENWVYVHDWSELHYEGRVTLNGICYQVLEHRLGGETKKGYGRPYEQHIYIGPDNLIHGYLLEYVCESKPAFQLAWLKNIKVNAPLKPADFAFTPPTAAGKQESNL